jgi:hypothetical protein
MNEQKTEFTSINELKQTGSLIDTLEAGLGYFYQFVQKMDSRRGIFNLGGNILQAL